MGIILVLFLTYYCTKWVSTKTVTLRSKYMNIIDRITLGQNKYIAIAEIYGKYYLLSITERHINILKELEDFQPLENEESNLNFNKILSAYKNQINRNKQ